MNGQTLGNEWPIAKKRGHFLIYVMLPKKDSMEPVFHKKYVQRSIQALASAGLASPVVKIIGEDPYSASADNCKQRRSFILFTNYVSVESPLRCGDCFSPVPLYEIPATNDEDYCNVISWQSDYQSCDTLQMNCSTGERFGTSQISRLDSSLSKRGVEICAAIEKSTGVPTYYYLYRSNGRSSHQEQKRSCPSCGKSWLLDKQLHDRFDFLCETCRLLSNIAWNVR